jgi:hypothetical protein
MLLLLLLLLFVLTVLLLFVLTVVVVWFLTFSILLFFKILVDYRRRFEELLKKANIIRPKVHVMERLQKVNAVAIMTAGTALEALHWYDWARELPQSVTRGVFKNLTGYELDGMHPQIDGIIQAGNDNNQSFMFKIAKCGEHEAFAATAVNGGPFVVGCRFERAEYTNDDGVQRVLEGLIMHRYECSLDLSPYQLAPQNLLHRAKAMILAINHIHSRNIVHMDVKEGNIFIKDGQWFLGDFGSCVLIEEAVLSTTRGCYPDSDLIGKPAAWRYDWYMLCVVIVRQLDVHNPFEPGDVESSQMVNRINLSKNEELKGLLTSLLYCDHATLTFDGMEFFEMQVHTVE